jgi:predicted alpha/beta-fold hydrolase
MNLRGQGSGVGLARRPYHAGCSEDLREVVLDLRREAPRSAVTVVGFSLGGNIAIKLAGELGADGGDLLACVVGVCPALDLTTCARRIEARENAIYQRTFLRELLLALRAREVAFPDDERAVLPVEATLRAFDHAYTAPCWGFPGATEYYLATSALELVPRVRIPMRILFADDDPIVDRTIADAVRPPDGAVVLRAPGGGHMGFLGLAGQDGVRWMDRVVLEWAPLRA